MYKRISEFLQKFIPAHTLYRVGFNWSPMYRRSTGRIHSVSKDLMRVEVTIPLSWRNVNYAGTIFGGSMLSATDPILMIQLVQILGNDFVVWDKAVNMRFQRPARERLFVEFVFTTEEVNAIRQEVLEKGETEREKTIQLRTKDGTVCATAVKTMYIATKAFYKEKRARKKAEKERAAN